MYFAAAKALESNIADPPILLQTNSPRALSSPTTKLRGSQLRNLSSPKQSPKPANVVSSFFKQPTCNSENSSDYVVIDTQYTFDRKKLSEHQQEALKSRRDDIPALYQDLTQDSQSNFLSQELNFGKNAAKENPALYQDLTQISQSDSLSQESNFGKNKKESSFSKNSIQTTEVLKDKRESNFVDLLIENTVSENNECDELEAKANTVESDKDVKFEGIFMDAVEKEQRKDKRGMFLIILMFHNLAKGNKISGRYAKKVTKLRSIKSISSEQKENAAIGPDCNTVRESERKQTTTDKVAKGKNNSNCKA